MTVIRRRISPRWCRLPLFPTLFLLIHIHAVKAWQPPLWSLNDLTYSVGESALQQVQKLGSKVATSEKGLADIGPLLAKGEPRKVPNNRLGGVGGSVYNKPSKQYQQTSLTTSEEEPSSSMPQAKERQVWEALANLENDMQLLDVMAGQKPQLSALEFTLLSAAVLSAASGPLLLNGAITEFLAPSAAAFTAAIGIGAEYTGKVAVADGKEVAAATIQCAAEAEGFLANAERAKAVTPLCVGLGATSASLALLVPVLLDSLGFSSNMQLVTEIYLCCPLISVLAAAVAALAVQETKSFCSRAIGIGNRRFARSGLIGRTWLSSTEQIERKSQSTLTKWKTFSLSVLPAPLLGAMVPGPLPTKTIVVAALAAAESAYFLAQAEAVLSRATDAVALKARSAAVCDTYANQGARSSAILPFTSALSSLCAAATAAIVELPFVETLASAGTIPATILQILAVSAFPAAAALFSAAASVSKARCEVDAEACVLAASTMALPYDDDEEDPILRPWLGVRELIKLTLDNSIREPFRRLLQRHKFSKRIDHLRRWFRRRLSRTKIVDGPDAVPV